MSLTAAALVTFASSDLAKKILEPIANKLTKEISGIAKEKWRKYTLSFDKYLNEIESKHKYFSSQVFSNEGQLLENYYIPLTLQKSSSSNSNGTIVVDDYPIDLLSAYKDVLIVDTAGMGKSTLLKFIFLRSLRIRDSIPIFVELRKLSKEKPIRTFILEELKLTPDDVNKKLLAQCLDEGIFTFFLDGFDEIPDDDKKYVSTQIVNLKNDSGGSRFILSSREEQSLAYLNEFHRFNIKPLSKDEAFDLIRKISPDPSIATSLIEKIASQSKDSLSEFLTNPLLVSLLVKSFLHSPILPVRLSEFYRQVFDALFQTHDAKKELGGFSRIKRSSLDLDRFHKALRALGVLSYQANKLEYSVDELLAQIEDVKILTSDDSYSASNFRHDLLHAVPLFVQEGSSSRWAHRSLQEYFAAAYICIDAKEDQSALLKQLYDAGVSKNANLLRLCADIDSKTFKHVIVKHYLASRLKRIERGFPISKFPEIDQKSLEIRRSILYETPPSLIVLPRSMPADKARSYVKKNLPGVNISNAYIGFNSSSEIAIGDNNARYFINIVGNKYESLDDIIQIYYQENIRRIQPIKTMRLNMRNFPFNSLLKFDDDPHNFINSKDNFTVTTQILLRMSYYLQAIYDVDKIRALHHNVIQHEKDSSNLTIKFG
ncbi:NACHT domain-containing protein [Massilia aurea]|uniref:NACHT domain-containing protein n=1 Tax=Massilia aurea TaxID=373040 RepID=UPI002161B1B2|nr:NACHT domain-containing protein [Massilia aurea]MCS0708856.1 NACHT domain-containing protein [Massilia aurea]